ncbi:Protein of unknown function [Selenomonas ruminantium]|uniref:DUF3990 domain-containing protein n=1 Tax=Selenomonas ruminantium TaxID=971 RepID=A0A1M6RLF9_SELRU|nr:DUF3990 domain-containing protein [Selenomonas ruminantium]SHK33266.1 Protein of unknown function [Selenomonas ruminantium]
MILYHGSNIVVREPKILKSQRFLDFGAGFYLTSDFEQAQKWAVRTTARRENGTPVVSVFEIGDNYAEVVKVLKFTKPDKEWLRYITAHRTGNPPVDDYDIVVGPVANDQAIRTVNNYLKGYFPEDVAIQLLLPQKLKDQYLFRTEKALQLLVFKEGRQV